MKLHALHHVTMITGDARANAAFYADALGLRLHHGSFGDETGSPGSLLTWLESPGAARGAAGAGMVHRVELGVAGAPALAFWKDRLDRLGVATSESPKGLRFADGDGLELELQGDTHKNPPLVAGHPDIPAEYALQGIQGARAYASDPGGARAFLTETLGFDHKRDHEYVLGAGDRHVHWGYDQSDAPGRPGAGTVERIAWYLPDAAHLAAWREHLLAAGVEAGDASPTAIAFRTPEGIQFEIATA
ncbi:MAG: glyoxalase family protein [Solirubrobacteraceae bacterium]|jgi:glyoxalase family protein|nr:glyoxalase family protein [Solirubrobacteraceae bacterium]